MSIGVFLGGLPDWANREIVESWLSEEGFQYNYIRGFSGCCVINVDNDDDADAIIARYDQAPLEDRILICELARSKQDQQKRQEHRTKRNGR